MGFVLTLLYILLALLSPLDLVPALAEYRIELLIALAALVFSLPGLLHRRFFQIPQIYLAIGLVIAVFLSVAMGGHWIGGGFVAVQQFLPAVIVFFLVVLNCQSIRKLQLLVSLLVLIAVSYVVVGAKAYLAGDINSPLLKVFPVGYGSVTFRMQGLGFLRDPNELAQFLVMILPLLWIKWRQGQTYRNIFFVMVPTTLLVWGVYLTHSRGGVLALLVILVLALKNRVRLRYVMLAGALAFFIVLALDFSGGREISLEAGSERLEMWGDGFRLFLQSPLFGIGFEGFKEQAHGRTAHNTFVVCLAELGITGYAFFIGLIAFTLSGLNSLTTSLRADDGSDTAEEAENRQEPGPEKIELTNLATALRISLSGFLVAAFFLSRAYALTLYLTLGMAVTLLYMASEDEEPVAGESVWRLPGLTARLGLAAIALVYLSLRIRSAFS